MNEMKRILESFRKVIKEDIYSSEIRKFIRIANKLEAGLGEDPNYHQILRVIETILYYVEDEMDLEELGTGAERQVFLGPSREVLKVARNNRALKANLREIALFNKHNPDRIFPIVEEHSPLGLWYLTEPVTTIADAREHNEYSTLQEVYELNFPKLFNLKMATGHRGGIEWNDILLILVTLNDFLVDKAVGEGDPNYKWRDQHYDRQNRLIRTFIKWRDEPATKEEMAEIFDFYNNPDKKLVKFLFSLKKIGAHPHDLDLHHHNVGFRDDLSFVYLDPIYE